MSDNLRVTKAAGVVGAITFLSRIFGYVRDMVIAGYFGTGFSTDVFIAAFRIPNLFRRLFGDGSLSISLTTIFTENLTRQGRTSTLRLAGAVLIVIALLLSILTIVCILTAPHIVSLVAPGFRGSPDKFPLAVVMTRWMAPYILLIGLVALSTGLLHTLGHFASPALAPVVFNVAMISAVLWICPLFEGSVSPIVGLAIGVLCGGVLQLVLQLPVLLRKAGCFWRNVQFSHPGLKKIGRMMVPTVFGSAVYQINRLVGSLLASLLPLGSISYLYFADRLVQFPLGLFGFAVATAVLPTFSKQASSGDIDGLKETICFSMKLVFFISLPAMTGLIVLREPIVSLLFQRGAFDLTSTRLTSQALLYYATGLWAYAGVRIVTAAFFALQDTLTPVKIAFLSIGANIALGIVLMSPIAHAGIAMAASLASMLNLILLVGALGRKLGSVGFKGVLLSAVYSMACSLAMALLVWATAKLWLAMGHSPGDATLLQLLACIFTGVAGYALLALGLKRPELKWFLAMFVKRR